MLGESSFKIGNNGGHSSLFLVYVIGFKNIFIHFSCMLLIMFVCVILISDALCYWIFLVLMVGKKCCSNLTAKLCKERL